MVFVRDNPNQKMDEDGGDAIILGNPHVFDLTTFNSA